MKNLFGLAILIILTLSSLADSRTRVQTAPSANEKSVAVNAFIAEQMRQFHIPGLSLVIVQHGKNHRVGRLRRITAVNFHPRIFERQNSVAPESYQAIYTNETVDSFSALSENSYFALTSLFHGIRLFPTI